jgi:hypothetical protein
MLKPKANIKSAIQPMKNKILIAGTILMLAAKPALGADDMSSNPNDLYRAKELSVDAFGSASLGRSTIDHLSRDRVSHNARLGAGMGMSYFITRNIGIGGDAYAEDTKETFIDSASANLILRLPLGDGGLAPYAFGGGGRQFGDIDAWFAQIGGGLEYRFTPHVGLFADGRWVLPEETKYYGVARLGLRFAF